MIPAKKYGALAAGLLLAACSSMDKVPAVPIDYATVWQYAPQAPAAIAIEKDWWKSFASTQLQQLIEVAQAESPDARIALENVTQAELQMKIANASLFPSLSASASRGESRSVANDGDWATSGSDKGSLSASYEVDLWGRLMAERHAQKSSYKATVFDTEATRLSIAAGMASAWFNYLALQERLATAEKNLVIAARIQKVVDSQYANGVASAADVAQQRTSFLSQQSALLPLQLQIDQTRAAIALLEGKVPQGFQLGSERLMDLAIPDIAAGVPSDLVTRRPDIGSMEAQLQGASADVYAARTALLPSVKLTGSKSASGIFAQNPLLESTGWSLTVAQTLFAGGKLKNQVSLSKSNQVVMVEKYRKTILTALQEVDDSLNRSRVTRQQEINQQEILVQAERSLRLTETRYREGEADLLSLLDAQRSLFQAQDALVQQRLARLQASVDLYKALGGGWQKPE